MIGALLRVRFRALFATASRGKKRRGVGTVILYVVLYLYLAAVLCGGSALLFGMLAESYHAAGLDWLYFAIAGIMGLGFAVFGSVFSTQSQLYDAKDNDLLLSMPIPPWAILLTRMIPLLLLNLLFSGVFLITAMVVYGVTVGSSLLGVLGQILCLLGIVLLAQAIACLLGWFLHLLLSKVHKTVASLLYMVLFFAIYFAVYSQAMNLVEELSSQGATIAAALRTWVWPLYAMGRACTGDPWCLPAFLGICLVLFGGVYGVLSLTFLRTTAMRRSSRRKKALSLSRVQVHSPSEALIRKELRKFLGSPVYLTNMGIGLILIAVLLVLGLIFRGQLLGLLESEGILEFLQPYFPLLLCALFAYLNATVCISTPSVSLEGKSLWILKSMPLTGRQILLGKLRMHCRLSISFQVVAVGILAIAYGCGPADVVLLMLVCGLLALLSGLVGLVAGLHWARLDYASEAYPCKQSVSVLVSMFGMMGLPLAAGIVYGLVGSLVTPTLFLGLCALLLLPLCLGFFYLLLTWGVKKWDAL